MRRRLSKKRWASIAILVLAVYSAWALLRPLPAIEPQYAHIEPITVNKSSLPWPGSGQAAIGAEGYGFLDSNGEQKAAPMASTAKIITALAVLKQKPLAPGQQGPTITFDATDVAYYQSYASQGGSVARVVAGEQISEYQALQTMILPSANNVAESLARWAFGSPEAYITYANKMVAGMEMSSTTLADASGFADQTVSSAKDMVTLGLAAMDNPVLAQIVGQNQAEVPVAGTIKSTNFLLGTDGFVGIKTGNTDQAGGCYLFASNQAVGSQNIKFVGAILGSPTLPDAMNRGRVLVDGAKLAFVQVPVVKAGQVVGSYKAPWSKNVLASATKNLSVLAWQDSKIIPAINLNEVSAPAAANTAAGSINVYQNQKTYQVPAVTLQPIPKAPWLWRLLHP